MMNDHVLISSDEQQLRDQARMLLETAEKIGESLEESAKKVFSCLGYDIKLSRESIEERTYILGSLEALSERLKYQLDGIERFELDE